MTFKIIILLCFVLSCTEVITESKESDSIIYTSSETVCDCHNSAVSIFSALLVEERLEYKELFWKLRQECLTKFGTMLYYESPCNNPDYLAYLADSLRLVGIDINQP